jgi:methyltransferase-like protein
MTDGTPYDVVDYPPLIHVAMHPSKLGAIGRLLGMGAASPRACRLLEVGCGDGLQLLALAQAYPDSRFVGVDLSAKAIARGEAMRVALGLDNLELVAADLTEWDPGQAPYDYIVAHGFFSWVPPFVRQHLLALCERALDANGIAYISYNALPGCHLRRMVWEMMQFHVREIDEPSERLRKARDFLAWLGNDTMQRGAYGPAIRHEALHLLNETQPAVMYHDDLSSINEPYSVTEFVGQARRHGLEFLGEADYHEFNPALLGAEAQGRLEAMCGDDRVLNDQYLDFLKGRRFRQTLLCRAPAAPASAVVQAGAVPGLEVSGHIRAEPLAGQEPARAGLMRFASSDGAAISTNHPVVQAALRHVGDVFPRPIRFERLLDLARREAGSIDSIEADADALAVTLARAFELGLVALHLDAPRFAAAAGDYPVASPLARAQAAAGRDLVANLRPSMVRLDSKPALELLQLLDGSRDRAAILQDLAARMAQHEVPGPDGILSTRSPEWWREQLAPSLEQAMALCVRNALLIGE